MRVPARFMLVAAMNLWVLPIAVSMDRDGICLPSDRSRISQKRRTYRNGSDSFVSIPSADVAVSNSGVDSFSSI